MRLALAVILLLVVAGCQEPGGSGPARDPAYGDRHGGMCSPYSSTCG